MACGCQNLLAILDALCDTDRPFTSNELADVLAGSMRFSCALIAFLRAVASRAMQEKPEAASRIIGHSSTLGAQDLRGLCSRHVEPLGAPPAQVANAMFNALAEEFDVCIKFHGYPSLANMASFPQGQSSCDRATLFIGHFSRAGQACFAILYPKLQRDRCPHFADIRRWASSRVGTIVKCNAPFKPWRIMKAYPPLPVDDSQLVAAAWQPARRDMTSPAFTRLRPGPQPASSTSKLKSQNESVRRKLDATLSKDNGTVRK